MVIKTIIFKRKKDSPVEPGVEIEGHLIIDKEGKEVSEVYDAKDVLGILIDMNPILEAMSKIKYKF